MSQAAAKNKLMRVIDPANTNLPNGKFRFRFNTDTGNWEQWSYLLTGSKSITWKWIIVPISWVEENQAIDMAIIEEYNHEVV